MKVKQGLLIVTLAAAIISAIADILPLPLRLLAILSASLPIYFLSKPEGPEVIVGVDHTDVDILLSLNSGPKSINSIAEELGVSWNTVRKRLNKLQRMQMVIPAEESFSLAPLGRNIVMKFNSHKSENLLSLFYESQK